MNHGWLLLLTLALAGTAAAEDRPKRVNTIAEAQALDPATERAFVSYRKGMFKVLADRCPNLRDLSVEEHSDLPADDVRELKRLSGLRRLEIFGDLGIGEAVFAAIGELSTLEEVSFWLG